MGIESKQQEIIDEFALFDDWMDRYAHLIEMGKELPLLSEQEKTEECLIPGCQSRVWLTYTMEEGVLHFRADSDAIITKGIIGLLIRVLDGETPQDIAVSDLHFIAAIGLNEHLSPTRANGLASMVKQLKLAAIQSIHKSN